MLCVNYAPIYKVQREKSTTALMERDNAEKMFTVLLLVYRLIPIFTSVMISSIVADINGVRGKMEIV